jgi:UDP-N-acetylmuramate--alanine ligase
MIDRKQVHFIGIGGTGLSAIARVLLERGYVVTGSDRSMSPMAKSLQDEGVRVEIGHRAENLEGAQIVVRSSAIPDDNVEVTAANRLGIPVLKRSEFLGSLMEGYFGIAVAGTHGKTSTTAMIAWILISLGQDPSYIIGGTMNNTGTNAHAGKGKQFVIEADEYDRMFLGLQPRLAVITNIEHDHPDCYPTEVEFFGAFDEFTKRVGYDGTLLMCANDRNAARLMGITRQRGQRVYSYAVSNSSYSSPDLPADYLADGLGINQDGGMSWRFECVLTDMGTHQNINLRIPGKHNVQNALAAMAVAHQLQLPLEQASRALHEFTGTGRRFEVRGEVNGIVIVDDYAHHPTEIKATIAAAQSRYKGRKIWVVWQPHTYSRTRLYLKEFVNAFELADHVLVTEIYAAREKQPADGFSSKEVVAAMTHPDVSYMADFSAISEYLASAMQTGDVLLVLSAGDADQISARVQLLLTGRSDKDE